jgi:hypothetical protein
MGQRIGCKRNLDMTICDFIVKDGAWEEVKMKKVVVLLVYVAVCGTGLFVQIEAVETGIKGLR